jgi:hypothetical protein
MSLLQGRERVIEYQGRTDKISISGMSMGDGIRSVIGQIVLITKRALFSLSLFFFFFCSAGDETEGLVYSISSYIPSSMPLT